MSAVPLLGLLSATFSIALMWPQVWLSCVNRRTNGLSATACWLTTVLCGSWLLYGVLVRDITQIATNAVTCAANAAVLGALLVTQPALRRRRTLLTTAGGAAALAAAAVAAATVAALPTVPAVAVAGLFGAVVSSVNIIACLPQPLTLLRKPNQDLSGLSPARWWLTATSATSWTAYGCVTGQVAVWTSSAVGLVCALVVCGVLTRRRLSATAATRGLAVAEAAPAAVAPTSVALAA